MPEENPVKKHILLRPKGSRRAGRPKLRWLDGLEEDLRTLGISGWRRKAIDRDRWKEVLTAARAQKGCNPISSSSFIIFVKVKLHCGPVTTVWDPTRDEEEAVISYTIVTYAWFSTSPLQAVLACKPNKPKCILYTHFTSTQALRFAFILSHGKCKNR